MAEIVKLILFLSVVAALTVDCTLSEIKRLMITPEYKEMLLKVGTYLHLYCSVTINDSQPIPRLTWEYPIKTNSATTNIQITHTLVRSELEVSTIESTLHITSVDLIHSGQYKCLMFEGKVLIANQVINVTVVNECDSGWFGPRCQYKSHCGRGDCEMGGGCPIDAQCDKGWFGPGCQYVDLVTSIKSIEAEPPISLTEITDSNDQTCLSSPDLVRLIVTWEQENVISWMRLYLGQPGAVLKLSSRTYNKTKSEILPCRTARATDLILDIECNPKINTKQLQITGRGLGTLCSIHISGGRNVALRQPTSQTSTRTYEEVDLVSSLAVDGEVTGYLRGRPKSCSSTSHSDKSPTWNLSFIKPKLAYRVVVHNRDVGDLLYRLKGFQMSLKFGGRVYLFTDTSSIPQEEYVFTNMPHELPLDFVKINAAPQLNVENKSETILALCEVEVFGDSDCQPGTYGFECENTCNCKVEDDICFKSTGACTFDSNCYCNETCAEEALKTDANPVLVGASVGAAVTVILVVIVVIVICRYRQRNRNTIPQVYDVPGSSEQHTHNYTALYRQGKSNGKLYNNQTRTLSGNHESKLYAEVDNTEYAELTD